MGRNASCRLVIACWLLLSLASPTYFVAHSHAQSYSAADQVGNLYRKYLDREPTANELTQWVWSFQKGLTLREAQATFLASDAYFARYARNANSFVSGMFTDVLGRPPSPVESLQWLHRFNTSQGDRGKLVRDFLTAAQGQVRQPASPPPSLPRPATPTPQREGQLVAFASLLHQALEEELGGTRQGRQLAVMSRHLITASRDLESVSPDNAALYRQALSDVEDTLTAMESQLGRVLYTAQASSLYWDRFQSLFASLGGGTGPALAPLPATTPSPAPHQVDADFYYAYIRLSSDLLSEVRQLQLALESVPGQDLLTSQLSREIDFFASQAIAVHQSLVVGQDKQDLRHEVLRLRALSQDVTRLMQQTGRVGQAAQAWQLVLAKLAQLGELVGVSTGSTIDPGQPIMLNLPTYHQLPYLVQRPTPAQLSREAIPICDQAIAHVDAFVAGFNRFLHLSPRVPALQAQARQLRVMLGQLREELARDASPQQIVARLEQLERALGGVSNLWVRTVQERQLTNTPDLNGVTGALQNLRRIYENA